MTRKIHDLFGKDYLKELLSPLGQVDISREVTDEARQIDILFLPFAVPTVPPESIGLLGKLVTQPSSIEIFRNQPDGFQLLMCANKLYSYFAELNRQAKRDDVPLDVENLGKLLMITPTASQEFLDNLGATLDPGIECQGVYSFPQAWRGFVIATNRLPVTEETLWLRILGKGRVQRRAVDELLALPDTNRYKESTLRLIANWRIVTIKQTNLTDDDQEIAMNLSTAYLEWEQKTLEEGRVEGRVEGEQKLVIQLLNHRIGEIEPALIEQVRQLSVEQMEQLALALMDFSTMADLRQWLQNRRN
jgi:hypothetical protein